MEPELDWLLRWRKQEKEPCPFPQYDYVIVQDVNLTPDIITRAVVNLNRGDYWRPLDLRHYQNSPPQAETGIEHYSPGLIVNILHSISKLKIDEFGELEAWFDDSQYPEVSTGFIPGSFTRELLELIERHLAK